MKFNHATFTALLAFPATALEAALPWTIPGT